MLAKHKQRSVMIARRADGSQEQVDRHPAGAWYRAAASGGFTRSNLGVVQSTGAYYCARAWHPGILLHTNHQG